MANLQPMEKEILTEVGNVSINAASQSLTSFVSGAINVKPPALKLLAMDELSLEETKGFLTDVTFREGVVGKQFLFFPAASAAVLAALLLGKGPPAQPPDALDEMEKSALSEVVSMFMGVYTTTLAGFTGTSVGIEPPQSEFISLAAKDFIAAGLSADEQMLVMEFILQFESGYETIFYQYIPYFFMREIITPLMPEQPATEVPPEAGGGAQDEIAALMADEATATKKEISLDDTQKDVLAEIGNISLGASATAFSELLNRKVKITTPSVTLAKVEEIRASYPVPCLVVTVKYMKGLTGSNTLILSEEDALAIVGIMMGMEPPDVPAELGEIELSGISEAMNQMMGSASTAMSDCFKRLIDISPPQVEVKNLHNESIDDSDIYDKHPVVQIAFRIEVEGLLDSTLIQLIPLPFALEMVGYLLNQMGVGGAPAGKDIEADTEEEEEEESIFGALTSGFTDTNESKKEGDEGLLAGLDILADALAGAESKEPSGATAASSALSTAAKDYDYSRIDMIRDIPISIHVLLGKTRLPLKKIFSLLPGEIIALERYLGEAVDVYANDRLVAKGEVVIVNGQFGIKIVDMLRL